MGKSKISRFSAAFDINKKNSFKLNCKTANLFAGEIYPVLASLEKFQPDIKAFSTTEGTLVLSNVDVKGPSECTGQMALWPDWRPCKTLRSTPKRWETH